MFRNGLLLGKLRAWRKPNPIDVLAKRLRALFPEIGAANPVLNHISELAPLHGGGAALAKSIFSRDFEDYVNSTDSELMDFIRDSVDRDFNENRLVVLEGWTLSQTEGLLLAFVGAGRT